MTDVPEAAPTVHIDVVSDVVCPWCYIGKRRLEGAIALAPTSPSTINWRPYFLNAWIPREGIDRQTYLETKFGSRRTLRRDRRAHLCRRRDGRPRLQSRQDQPAAQHARLPPPHPVVAQRHRSGAHEAAADGALFRRRRRSERRQGADPGRGRLRHGRRSGAPASCQRRRCRPHRKRRQPPPRKPASTACPASSSARASSSPARNRRNIWPAPSSAHRDGIRGCGRNSIRSSPRKREPAPDSRLRAE